METQEVAQIIQSKSKTVKIIILIVVSAILIAGGIMYYINTNKPALKESKEENKYLIDERKKQDQLRHTLDSISISKANASFDSLQAEFDALKKKADDDNKKYNATPRKVFKNTSSRQAYADSLKNVIR